MDLDHLLILCGATFLVSILGVVTGGHSMLTVPLMIFFGMPPAVAVATNRFANIFLAGSGAYKFYRNKKIPLQFTWPFIVASIPGGAAGALVVLHLSGDVIQKIIGAFMVLIVVVGLVSRQTGLADLESFDFSRLRMGFGLVIGFLIGIYWGFFGGGGMTLFILFLTLTFGLSFLQSVGTSNLAMGLSSLLAVIIFMVSGAVDFVVGTAMAVCMAGGAWIGAHWSIRVGNVWVKRVFTAVILILAVKLIFGWPDFKALLQP